MNGDLVAVGRRLLVLLALLPGCQNADRRAAPAPPSDATSARAEMVDAADPPDPPLEAKTIPVTGDLPVFFIAGRRRAAQRMVFLHGACTHGLGYIQSFAFTASARGSLMALQGERDCGHGLRSWTSSPPQAHARIEAGFAAARDRGAGTDAPIVAIGYSQGAMVAESLAARYPSTYRRLILIGAPRPVDATALRALEGAVLMAGTFDNRAVMQQSEKALALRGIPATFIEIPNARHGQLNDAEAIMERALAWLDDHARPATDAGP